MNGNIISLIISLIFLINIINANKTNPYRCGTNNIKIRPEPLEPKIEINKTDPSYKRRIDDIDEDGFKKFNIYVDKINIEKDIIRYKMEKYRDIIFNSLDKAAGTLQKLLKVKPLEDGFQFSDKDLHKFEIYDWDTEKFGDGALDKHLYLNTLGIDLVIFPKIIILDEGTIAQAYACYSQPSNHQPILGIVEINRKINFTSPNIEKYIESTLIHEMTHILGFSGYFFEEHFKIVMTKLDKYGIKRTYINSPKVVEAARKYFNCSELDGVELEDYGGDGTAGSHWEARILLGDYMNGVYYSEEVISEITLALLEDIGFYKPYYYTGGLMRYGKNKGCEFVYDKCVNQTTYEINPKFENEFFDELYTKNNYDPSCTSGRLSRMYNIWWYYKKDIPEEYQYYNGNIYMGGWSAADFCPVPTPDIYEEAEMNYPGMCSGKEGGVYGSYIEYTKSDGTFEYYLNKDIAELTGEEISEHSFCFLSSLYKNNILDAKYYSQNVRAICYKLFCSEKSLTVKIHDDYIVCPRSGGKIKVKGYEGYFLCPDYNLMCTGTVMCNDLFDCVDKESEVKEESFIYDYEIKTSQNIIRAEESEIETDNYELSDNGICSKYCKQCKENNICLDCKEGYYLLGKTENEEVICEKNDNNKFETGYYHNENNVYYKCIFNCDVCSDSNSCNKCKEGIEYNYNQCININIPNCAQSNEQGICEKCYDNFAFNDTDKSFCLNKEIFINNNYYTKDNGMSYIICSKGISNCAQCEYDNINSNNLQCTLCEDDYALSVDENKCILKEEINTNKEYYYIDESSIKCKKCSGVLRNCLKCTNGTVCDKCMKKNYFINEQTNACYEKSEINLKEYFLNEDKTIYFSCNNYNLIQNCKECSNKDVCKNCIDGYELNNGICEKNDISYLQNWNLCILFLAFVISYLF